MKIFEELKKDHEVQRDLLKQLVNSSTQGDEREELVKKVEKELKSHAKSEERYFYIEMIKHDKSQEDARHSISEHHDIDEKLEELMDTKTDSTAWLTHAKNLKELVTHHLDEEEEDIFEVAEKVLSGDDQQELGNGYRKQMEKER